MPLIWKGSEWKLSLIYSCSCLSIGRVIVGELEIYIALELRLIFFLISGCLQLHTQRTAKGLQG